MSGYVGVGVGQAGSTQRRRLGTGLRLLTALATLLVALVVAAPGDAATAPPSFAVGVPSVVTGPRADFKVWNYATDPIVFGRLDPATNKVVDGTYLVRMVTRLVNTRFAVDGLYTDPVTLQPVMYRLDAASPTVDVLTTFNFGPAGLGGGEYGETFWQSFKPTTAIAAGAVVPRVVETRLWLVTSPGQSARLAPGTRYMTDFVNSTATAAQLVDARLMISGGAR